ncbi:MAG: hypothetical protein H0X13_15585 [Ramlibacter sp.]|nr:hypothetical protein [Ramlibacter sp.]
MTTKLEKCAFRLNDDFSAALGAAFKEKFSRELETNFNIFSMTLISEPADGEPFTPEQKEWVGAYSDGYEQALEAVCAMANGATP